jgi:hypothetical protein
MLYTLILIVFHSTSVSMVPVTALFPDLAKCEAEGIKWVNGRKKGTFYSSSADFHCVEHKTQRIL